MYKFLISFFLLVVLTSNCAPVQLPASFTKCDKKQSDFKQCLVKSAENAVNQLTHPIKEVGLSSIDPLEFPTMSVPPGSAAALFQQNYKDLKISGFSKAKFSKFDVDFDKKTILFECTFPQVLMEFQYDFNGTVVSVPFYGKGPGSFTIDDLTFIYTFNLEEYEKKGAKHYKIIGSKLTMVPKLITFKFDNLLDGDEKNGKRINQVFNDNWKVVFGDVSKSYEDNFNNVFTSVFGKLLENVPISELF